MIRNKNYNNGGDFFFKIQNKILRDVGEFLLYQFFSHFMKADEEVNNIYLSLYILLPDDFVLNIDSWR